MTSIEDTIRERIDLSDQRISEIANLTGLTDHRSSFAALLRDNIYSGYVNSRIAVEARECPPLESVQPDPIWGLDPGDDGWPKGTWGELFQRPRGKPRVIDPLEWIYDTLSPWWEEITGRKWCPRFELWEDTPNLGPQPIGDDARLFWAVALVFDAKYSAKNCNSVCDDQKNLRRSSEAQARRTQHRREKASEHYHDKKQRKPTI